MKWCGSVEFFAKNGAGWYESDTFVGRGAALKTHALRNPPRSSVFSAIRLKTNTVKPKALNAEPSNLYLQPQMSLHTVADEFIHVDAPAPVPEENAQAQVLSQSRSIQQPKPRN